MILTIARWAFADRSRPLRVVPDATNDHDLHLHRHLQLDFPFGRPLCLRRDEAAPAEWAGGAAALVREATPEHRAGSTTAESASRSCCGGTLVRH
jgi:hypothetical protein